MTDAPSTLADLLDAAWEGLARGVRDREAPARHPTLATVGRTGGAEARTVVLRGADRQAATLTVHTDSASGKCAEIAADPRGTALIWDPGSQLQTRLRVRLAARRGLAMEWAAVPEASRALYGGAPPPGTPVPTPDAAETEPDPERFAVLTAQIEEIDVLHIGADRHTRALFQAADGFAGVWIVP